MVENLDNALHAYDDILFYHKDFDKVTFIAKQKHILEKNNLYNNFDEMTLTLIFISDFWLGAVNLTNVKDLKKINEKVNANSVPIVWFTKRLCNFCISEIEIKEVKTIFTELCF